MICGHVLPLTTNHSLPSICIGFVKESPRDAEALRSKDGFVGTPNYASISALEGCRQGPKDDIESLGYSLLEMYLGESQRAVPSLRGLGIHCMRG